MHNGSGLLVYVNWAGTCAVVITFNITVETNVHPDAASVPVTVYVQVGVEMVAGGVDVLEANVLVGTDVTLARLLGVINNETCG